MIVALTSLASCAGPADIDLSSILQAGAAKDYNVLVITLDTTRADHLGLYGDGDAKTPALDRLAAGGVTFEHAMTPVPITLPAHASLMTGLYPHEHGVRNNAGFRLSDHAQTLAEVLSEHGYRTGAVVGAFVLASAGFQPSYRRPLASSREEDGPLLQGFRRDPTLP